MAEGTVRGAFELNVSQPIRGVRDYRREAARADVQTRQLGSSIDRAFGEKQVASIDRVKRSTTELGTQTTQTRKRVRQEWQGMRRDVQREAAAISSTIAVVRDRMRQLGRETARPHIDVSGITAAITQIELLTARLEQLGAMRATPRIGLGGGLGSVGTRAAGGVVAGGGRGAGRGGGSALVSAGGIGFAGLRGRTLLGGAALALPAAQALGGAGGALIGSAGSAALGAGAAGLGGLAPLIAGVGAVMSVAKPANAALKEVWKAQDDYTKAVREHGRWSKEAAAAQREVTRQSRIAGPGSSYATQQARGFGQDWRRLSRPARQQYYGLIGDAAQIGRRVAPGLAQNALTATTAVRGAGTHQARFLAGNRMQDDLGFFTRTFARELPTAERTLENVERTLVNISRASVPFFHEANVWAREQTAGWRSATTNISQTRREMEPMVESAKRWAHLTGTTWDLLKTIGQAGRPSGDSLVGSLDRTFSTWDRWLESHPQETASFFRDTANSTRDMARGLARAVRYLNELSSALRPLLDRFSQLVGLASSLGLIGTPGAIAAAVGGVRAFRRGGAGAGGAAGGAAAGGGGGGLAGGGLAPVVAAGAAGLAGRRVYGSNFRSGAPVSQLGRRRGPIGRLGGRAAGVAGGAARGFLPVGLALGALDFATFEGGPSIRGQAALSSATLGLVHRPRTMSQAADAGTRRAENYVGDLSADPSAASAAIRRRMIELRGRTFHQGGGALNPFGGKTFSGAAAERNLAGAGDTAAGRDVVSELRALGMAYRDQRQTVLALHRAERARLDDLSRRRGAEYGSRLGDAFRVYRGAGSSREKAGLQVAGQVRERLAGSRATGAESLGESSLAWASALAKGHPEMKSTVDELTKAITARFKKLGRDIRIVNGNILTGTRSEWKGIADAMTGASERARQKTRSDFTEIQRQAIGSLIAMGMTPSQARSTVQGLESGSSRARDTVQAYSSGNAPKTLKGSGLVGGGAPNARGGTIGGRGLLDTIPTGDGGSVAPGETWIANRHTMGKLSMATRAVFGLTAEQMIRGETRRHSSPMARGGSLGGGGLQSGISSLAGAVTGQFPGLSVTSTTGGRHAAGSYHYRGMAVDIGGPGDVMNRAAAWVARRYGSSLAEGIHNPNLSVKNGRTVPSSFWGSKTWAGHADHIHLAVAGALAGGSAGLLAGGGGGLAGGQISVRGLGQRQPGVPGIMRGRAGDIYAAGLQRQVNAALGGGGGTTAGAMGGSLAQMIASVGLPPIFNAIVRAESGGNPRARNASGASGLTQIMMPLHQGLVARYGGNVFDPMTNLRVAKHLYDQSGLSPWTASRGVWGASAGKARGGRLKWAGAFEKGGAFTTDGPTAFVAGEGRSRRERVTVTPAGGNSNAAVHVTFAPGSIVINAGRGGSVDAGAVGEAVARKIIDAIQRGASSAVLG